MFTFGYYTHNYHFEGYELNYFFNEDLVYQGPAVYLGELESDMGSSTFVNRGGAVHYYDEWVSELKE